MEEIAPHEREVVEALRFNRPGAAEKLLGLTDAERARVLEYVADAGRSGGDGGLSGNRAAPRWSRRKVQFVRGVSVVLFVAGCLVAAAAVGWWVRDGQATAVAPLMVDVSIDRPVAVPMSSDVVVGYMPSVLGLSLGEARRVLFDAGISAAAITVTKVLTVLEEGTVVVQDPLAGLRLGDSVSLVVSLGATVPDLVGMELSEAESLLEELGSLPMVERVSGVSSAPGVVVGSEPGAGEPLGRSILLRVSQD